MRYDQVPYIEFIVIPPKPIKQEMSIHLNRKSNLSVAKQKTTDTIPERQNKAIYLTFDQDQINEQDHEIMLDVFIGKPFTSRALSQTDAFRKVCLAMRRVEVGDRIRAFDTYWHRGFWSHIVDD